MELTVKFCLLLFALLALTIHGGHCRPRIFGSEDAVMKEVDQWIDSDLQNGNHEKSLRIIEAGLEIVQLLPSDILHRKITDAVVVLGQALENQNPILQSAIENALIHMEMQAERDVTSGFLSFLRKLKTEMSVPRRFPEQFSQWMKNQITIVETNLVLHLAKMNKLIHNGAYGNDLRLFANSFSDKVVNFDLFIQSGLKKLESRPELQFNLEISALRESFAAGKYHEVSAAVVWEHMTQDDPESLNILHALRDVYKRVSPICSFS